MLYNLSLWLKILLAVIVAFLFSFAFTPLVKKFAEALGAIDNPNERRINTVPIPRMGGLAIFVGVMVSILMFVEVDKKISGVIIGSLIIVIMGAVDDIINLKAWIKLVIQVVAAIVAVRCGVVMDGFSNINLLSAQGTVFISKELAVILTIIWIVGCTNAVNLIDGLDGLAVGVSAISAASMFFVSLMVSEYPAVSILLAALLGACLGFMPYNLNPAKIFMGDVGSQFLGFLLSTVSVIGLFKLHALITFLVPLIALAVPLADTIFAIVRRLLRGQSPFVADKGHFHHRLLASGLSQKQAVAVLYGISAVLGLFCVVMAGEDRVVKFICLAVAFVIALCMWLFVFKQNPHLKGNPHFAETTEEIVNVVKDDKIDKDIKIYKNK